MLDASGMKAVMFENRGRLIKEFEAEYPELVEMMENKIKEVAKLGNREVTILLDEVSPSLETIREYLEFLSYKVFSASSGKMETTYLEDGRIKEQRSVRDSLTVMF
jgi:hypothetical protein